MDRVWLPSTDPGRGKHYPMSTLDPDRLLHEAVIAGAAGDHRVAVSLIRCGLASAPGRSELWANLGIASASLGRPEAAVASALRAVALSSGSARMWLLLGGLAVDAKSPLAIRALRRSLPLDPADAAAWSNFSLAARNSGDFRRFVEASRRAVFLDPTSAQGWNNFGLALTQQGQVDAARTAFQKALARDGTLASAHANYGHVQITLGEIADGLVAYRRAIVYAPAHAEALTGLAGALKDQSLAAQAFQISRWAMASDPLDLPAARSHLTCLLHLTGISPEASLVIHRRVMGPFERRILPFPAPANGRDPERPLRIAYVSSDFSRHPNGRYLKAAFEHRDRKSQIVCIYSDAVDLDAEAQWYRESADLWRDVRSMSDTRVAGLLREDAIDILVVLSSHFDNNRPLLAAYGVAPIQISMLDGATSGIERMTHWLTDPILHPEDTSERFVEALERIPILYYFEPPEKDPPVAPPPMLRRGFPTFGCFVSPARINPDVIACWSRILMRVPDAQLLLKNRTAFRTSEIQRRYHRAFEAHGVDLARIRLMSANDDRFNHQARYSELDIVLDTFPFNGASATFDALWMGVPVVTLSGWSFTQRLSQSLLEPISMKELIAHSPDQYEEIAVSLARRADYLYEFRTTARPRIRASRLCDGKAYAQSLDAAFRRLWRQWCSGPTLA